ncbi:MAG: cyanophycin synthetase, partial [Rhodococcus sp. (in: high G+C Gram-positive bacteria)]|uniref:glutamate ligase domain-containing protein n=1 Tax=Rhodococcus sp. TaxID=1831 RepID=UPI003BB7DE50
AEAGADLTAAADGIATVSVPGRVELVDRGQDFLAVVDYAHKPAALEAVIATLRGRSSGRIAVVVGAGGDRDRGKRALMGAVAARGAEFVVITDDNPRTEDPAAIRAAMLVGTRSVPDAERGEIVEIGDRAAAIDAAVRWAGPGDVVLVAGKGHERGQEIHGIKHPFDDREVLADVLERTRTSRSAPQPDDPGRNGTGGTRDGGTA